MPDPDPPSMPETSPASAPRRARGEAVVDYGVAPLDLSLAAVDVEEFVEPEPVRLEVVPEPVRATQRDESTLWGLAVWAVGSVLWFFRCLFGIVSMIVALAFISAVPGLNFYALGYLLDVEGRVARSGRIRDAFPMISQIAPRVGSIALGIWVWVFPLRFLSDAAADARIIDPGGFADIALHLLLPAACVLVVLVICLALSRGGRLRDFSPIPLSWLLAPVVVPFLAVFDQPRLVRRLRALGHPPILTHEYWLRAEGAVSGFIASLRLKELFWLGLRGAAGAFLWLVIPTAFFAFARKTEGGPILITVFGGLLLVIVLSWVPFLQAHFAAENRFGAMFELGAVRRLYGNSPLCWLLSVVLTLALALPLYLAKVALPPRDAMWMVTLLFIVTIYPVKVLTGWAYHRALTRPKKAFFLWRWLCWLVMYPLLAFYVFILFFTQFIGEHGKGVLFEHHAFLLPVPF